MGRRRGHFARNPRHAAFAALNEDFEKSAYHAMFGRFFSFLLLLLLFASDLRQENERKSKSRNQKGGERFAYRAAQGRVV